MSKKNQTADAAYVSEDATLLDGVPAKKSKTAPAKAAKKPAKGGDSLLGSDKTASKGGAKKASKAPAEKAVKASKLKADEKLKPSAEAAREGTMMAKVQDAFRGGVLVSVAVKTLKKGLKQKRGSQAETNADAFVLGYISGARRKGLLVAAK